MILESGPENGWVRLGSLYARPRLPEILLGVGLGPEELVEDFDATEVAEDVDGVVDVVLVELSIVLVGVVVDSEESVVVAFV